MTAAAAPLPPPYFLTDEQGQTILHQGIQNAYQWTELSINECEDFKKLLNVANQNIAERKEEVKKSCENLYTSSSSALQYYNCIKNLDPESYETMFKSYVETIKDHAKISLEYQQKHFNNE
jgi:hypothetical protein